VLLMDVDTGSEHERKDWDGPQPAIEKFDLSADKAARVTGKDELCLGTVLAERQRIPLHHPEGK
jgi:hypothetical protein